MNYQERAQQFYQEVISRTNGAIIQSHVNEIYPGQLYLGAQPQDGYPYPPIKAVVNLQAESQRTLACDAILWLPINDGDNYKGLDWLRVAVGFIERNVELGWPTLVHCAAGVSRSSFVVIAYVMKREGLTVEEAWRFVRDKRPVAPNPYFLAGLYEWYDYLTNQG